MFPVTESLRCKYQKPNDDITTKLTSVLFKQENLWCFTVR